MKHRFTIPGSSFDYDADMEGLGAWLRGRGWSIVRVEVQHTMGHGPWLHAMIAPRPSPLPGSTSGVSISVSTGATLIYDDVEQSMGVTMLGEPRDAVPADEPIEDALPWELGGTEFSFVDRYADPSLIIDQPPRRWPRRPR